MWDVGTTQGITEWQTKPEVRHSYLVTDTQDILAGHSGSVFVVMFDSDMEKSLANQAK